MKEPLKHLAPQLPLYPPRIFCRALNISTGTFSTWNKRGWLANLKAATADVGPGQPTMLPKVDVLGLALVKAASKWGATYPEVIGAAPKAASSWLKYRGKIRELTVRWYGDNGGRVSVRYNDDAMAQPAEPNADFTVTLNLDKIFGEAERALEETLRADARAPEVKVDELGDLRISRVRRG